MIQNQEREVGAKKKKDYLRKVWNYMEEIGKK